MSIYTSNSNMFQSNQIEIEYAELFRTALSFKKSIQGDVSKGTELKNSSFFLSDVAMAIKQCK